jgi:hypothetical protein
MSELQPRFSNLVPTATPTIPLPKGTPLGLHPRAPLEVPITLAGALASSVEALVWISKAPEAGGYLPLRDASVPAFPLPDGPWGPAGPTPQEHFPRPGRA